MPSYLPGLTDFPDYMKDLLYKHCPHWKLLGITQFSDQTYADRCLGLCEYSSKSIYVRHFHDKDTLLHEIAHALCNWGDNHGPAWQAKLSLLREEEGLPPIDVEREIPYLERMKDVCYGYKTFSETPITVFDW